ncbi:MAG: PepSY-associated TM helix domain-containing protein [Acidobacteriota bacterium]
MPPDRPARQASIRSRLLFVHRWIGFTAGLVFAIAAGTGAILVYADELDALMRGPRVHTTPGLLEPFEIEAAIHRHAPDSRLMRVIWPGGGANVLGVRVSDGTKQRDLVLDAGSGALLDPRPQHPLLSAIRRLHAGLLIGPIGGRIVQVASCVSLVTLGVGLMLWWPGLRRAARALRIRFDRGTYALNLDLHQTLGILALPLLGVMTVTGVLIDPAVLGGVSRWLNAAEPASVAAVNWSPAIPGLAEIGLSTAADMAVAVSGGAALAQITFPGGAAGVVEVHMIANEGTPGAALKVALDRHSGEVLHRQLQRYDAGMNARLHFGLAGGPVVRALYAISCVIGFGLLPTGLTVYWLKQRRRVGGMAFPA